jgi:hypothetical protein
VQIFVVDELGNSRVMWGGGSDIEVLLRSIPFEKRETPMAIKVGIKVEVRKQCLL